MHVRSKVIVIMSTRQRTLAPSVSRSYSCCCPSWQSVCRVIAALRGRLLLYTVCEVERFVLTIIKRRLLLGECVCWVWPLWTVVRRDVAWWSQCHQDELLSARRKQVFSLVFDLARSVPLHMHNHSSTYIGH